MIGGILAGGIIGKLHGKGGFEGWQWLFVVSRVWQYKQLDKLGLG